MIFAARIATLIAATLTPQAGGLGSTPPSLPAVVQAQGPPGAGPALQEDPFQRAATLALAGKYGKLQTWQREGYARGLKAHTDKRLLLTAYWLGERGGRIDANGMLCTLKTMASNRIAQRSWVWTELTGIRVVSDTGASSNDRKADRAGCDAWADAWHPTKRAARRAGIDGWTPVDAVVIGR